MVWTDAASTRLSRKNDAYAGTLAATSLEEPQCNRLRLDNVVRTGERVVQRRAYELLQPVDHPIGGQTDGHCGPPR